MTELEGHAHRGHAEQDRCEGATGLAPALSAASPEGEAREMPARRARRGGSVADELPPGLRDRLSDGLVDELLSGARTEEEVVGPGGLLADLTRRLVKRALSAELTDHLGHEPHHEPAGGTDNTRNGTTPKTLVTEHGRVAIKAPRDRNSSFEPTIVRKDQRRSTPSTTSRAGCRSATSRRTWPRSTA
jgi:hypothetical protein